MFVARSKFKTFEFAWVYPGLRPFFNFSGKSSGTHESRNFGNVVEGGNNHRPIERSPQPPENFKNFGYNSERVKNRTSTPSTTFGGGLCAP
jgi:hypothetical protein